MTVRAAVIYQSHALRKEDAKAVSQAAEELGLCVTREGRSKDLVVYKSGEELLFGTVPYSFDELGLHPVVLLLFGRLMAARSFFPPRAVHEAFHEVVEAAQNKRERWKEKPPTPKELRNHVADRCGKAPHALWELTPRLVRLLEAILMEVLAPGAGAAPLTLVVGGRRQGSDQEAADPKKKALRDKKAADKKAEEAARKEKAEASLTAAREQELQRAEEAGPEAWKKQHNEVTWSKKKASLAVLRQKEKEDEQAARTLRDKRRADKENAANSRARKKGVPLPFPERATLGKTRRDAGAKRRDFVAKWEHKRWEASINELFVEGKDQAAEDVDIEEELFGDFPASSRTERPTPQTTRRRTQMPTLRTSALKRWTPEPLQQATHIQASAIPKILEGQDVSIQSETGSGKTLAYLLPAAHFAAQATYGEDDEEWEDMDDEMLAEQEEEESRAKDHEFEARMPEEPQKSVCYKVKQTATRKGTRLVSRPEEFATPTGKKIYQGDEFMSKSVSGSPLGLHFIELADGRGWFPWDRKDLMQRFSLTARQYSKGQRVEAKETIEYGSGDIVKLENCDP
ncbi:DEAD-box ATP-dependent RNA helicase 16 [Symbiodinium microadriaticum]|uniref:RNA helicase n=1 Tax=Symbiodinium microadriaticum TaxID=2951 RepID=A0A1Q9DJ50_SYMMI|nr:DEAD-box ATP-dependent RNA helicase 16 [Symbiodinium microadriaticum]